MDRKVIYATVVLGYYTFLLIFSFLSGFYELIIGSVIVGILSLVWFLYAISMDNYMLSVKELATSVGAYTFGTSLVVFVSIQISSPIAQKQFGNLELSLSIIPIFIWVILWFDIYRIRKSAWGYG